MPEVCLRWTGASDKRDRLPIILTSNRETSRNLGLLLGAFLVFLEHARLGHSPNVFPLDFLMAIFSRQEKPNPMADATAGLLKQTFAGKPRADRPGESGGPARRRGERGHNHQARTYGKVRFRRFSAGEPPKVCKASRRPRCGPFPGRPPGRNSPHLTRDSPHDYFYFRIK